ncbi:hypothetical protein TL16_g06696 [Triparma laevis f. inornata]|uniref:Uncharacterized protein n=1 Tax=Triparma laevis f. inornata TaxID=1714386 RepID=A0A9W7ALR2_9STRA|nr:hypothetical protein TL16_g06696 [Triparma laevis f. inornata]
MTTKTYTLYRSRWLQLLLFCLSTCVNAALWTTFAPISTDSSSFFFPESKKTETVAINMIALLYQICYLPGTLLASYLVDKGGLRSAVVLGTSLTALGSAIRWVSVVVLGGCTSSYCLVLLGQFLCALGQPCFVNAPGLLAANWFGADERDIATTVASLFAVIGNAVGQIMPPAMVDSEVTDDDGSPANGDDDVHGVEDLLLSQAILSLLCFLGVYVYFVSHPPTSPSSSTEARDKMKGELEDQERLEEKEKEKEETKKPLIPASSFNDDASLITVDVTVSSEICRKTALQSPESIEEEDDAALRKEMNSKYGHLASAGIELFKDPNYRLLFLAFGLGLALFNALLTVVNNILKPCGYTEDDAGGFAAALIGAGLLGAGFAGYAMDTYHAYRPLLKAGFSCAAVTCFILASSIKADNSTMLYVVFGMLGFFMIPMLPVMIENR